MKIGFDAKRALFNHSGLGNYSRTLIQSLQNTFPQHHYFLYSAKTSSNYITDFTSNSIQIIKADSFLHKAIPSYWRRFVIPSVAKKNDIDIYHGLSHELPVGIEKTGIKTVVTIHDLIFERFPHHYSAIDVLGYRKKIKHACNIAHMIVTISEQTKQDLIQFYKIDSNKIKVIYQGCDNVFGNANDQQQDNLVEKKYHLPSKYILHVGGFTERKNHLKLLQAFNIIKQQTDAHVVFVGNGGKEEKKVKQYIEENKLSNRVLFISSINNLDLSYVYKKASLFVYNSLFEGFGIPILEAFASNVPVLTSTGSCFKEVGGDACLYSNPDDENALAQNILLVLNNNNTKEELKNKGKERLHFFDNEKIAQNYMNLYVDVLQST